MERDRRSDFLECRCNIIGGAGTLLPFFKSSLGSEGNSVRHLRVLRMQDGKCDAESSPPEGLLVQPDVTL